MRKDLIPFGGRKGRTGSRVTVPTQRFNIWDWIFGGKYGG